MRALESIQRQTRDDAIVHANAIIGRPAHLPNIRRYTDVRTRTHKRVAHTHTHTGAQPYTHTRKHGHKPYHTHTHTHTHTGSERSEMAVAATCYGSSGDLDARIGKVAGR
jgi:hypothetical protein